jgi:aminotransferase
VGGSEGIDLVFRAILNPGDEVLIPEPCFVSYKPCAFLAGGTPVTIPLKAVNEFRLTPEEIEAAITPKTKAIILSFPTNPTGAIMEKEDLEKIASVIIKNDLIVISDEIYAELTYDREHYSIACIEGMKERTIVVSGFSKAYSMTGWRMGYALGPNEIIAAMTKIHQYAIMCTPTTSQYAAVEAAKNGDADVEEMRVAYNQRRRFIVDGFRNMGLDCFEPLGAFYIFPSIQKTGLTSEEFATRLLYEQKVAVVPGSAFGDCGEGFIRCSYAYSIDNLKIAIERIGEFVKQFDLN